MNGPTQGRQLAVGIEALRSRGMEIDGSDHGHDPCGGLPHIQRGVDCTSGSSAGEESSNAGLFGLGVVT
jgi:hypothetical protein